MAKCIIVFSLTCEIVPKEKETPHILKDCFKVDRLKEHW